MIYIKRIFEDVVQVGGETATEEMLQDGWFEYDGEIPQGTDFKLIDGVLVPYISNLSIQLQISEYKDYLSKTDHKFYNDYELKDGETLKDIEEIRSKRKIARDYIRDNEIKPIAIKE